MEEIDATNPEYQPLQVYYGACLFAHTQKTISLATIHLFTQQIVPSLHP